MSSKSTVSPSEIEKAIDVMATEITSRHTDAECLTLVAIANGGIVLAQRLFAKLTKTLGEKIHLGTIDITFHRDDLFLRPIPKPTQITDLPHTIEEGFVILVDDVLFSGRSARAAINELFDVGRPERVELAVLVDRGHQRLPLYANYVGIKLKTEKSDKVLVQLDADNPENDTLVIERKETVASKS